MSAWRTSITPQFCVHNDASVPARNAPTSAPGIISPDTATSANWAGQEADGFPNQDHYNGAAGEWNEAHSQNFCSDPQNSHVSWVGLGGDASWDGRHTYTTLIQAGTLQEVGHHYFWWETIGSQGDTHIVQLVGMGLSDGDTVYAEVDWDPGAVRASIFVDNLTTGQSLSFQEGYPGAYSGATAEAIDERVDMSGTYTQLRRFDTTSWIAADARTGSGTLTWNAIRSLPHDGLIMEDIQSTILIHPGNGINGIESFTDPWSSCGVRQAD